MFIISKRNYSVRRADGSSFLIGKDYIGNIPDDVAQSSLVQRALKAGMIFCPPGTKDKQLEQADREAKEKSDENDKRPDARGKGKQADAEAKEKADKVDKG